MNALADSLRFHASWVESLLHGSVPADVARNLKAEVHRARFLADTIEQSSEPQYLPIGWTTCDVNLAVRACRTFSDELELLDSLGSYAHDLQGTDGTQCAEDIQSLRRVVQQVEALLAQSVE